MLHIQLILSSQQFNQPVRLRAISIKTTSSPSQGPRTIKLFINHPNLDFSDAESEQPVQEFELTPEQLKGGKIDLRFVRFQNVNSLYVSLHSLRSTGFFPLLSLPPLPPRLLHLVRHE